MFKISQMAKMFHLSRSTILYYESIGLLKADKRTDKNYRLYSQKSVQKLEMICELRNTGIPLSLIKKILSNQTTYKNSALQERLYTINQEIQSLRRQQQVIVNILQQKGLAKKVRFVNKEQWVHFLQKAGLDEEGMGKWHRAFEKSSPECHQDFLESIGLSEKEIQQIRSVS